MYKKLIFVLALSTAGAFAAPQPSDAFSRARPDGSFLSAAMPGAIDDQSGVRDTVVGDITHNTLSTDEGDAELSITATQLPAFVTTVSTDNMIYRKARNELLGNYGAKRTRWTRCRHAGYACRKLTYEASGGRQGMARFYLHDDTLVIANAVWEDDAKNAKQFLRSVK